MDLEAREIKVRGKGGRDRIVKISHEAARRLDRYLRVRSRHELAYRPELWLGAGNRGPLDRSGIYQLVVRRGQECGVRLYPHRFRHHFSHIWLERGGAGGPDGAERLGLAADADPLRGQRPRCPCPPQLRPRHERPALTGRPCVAVRGAVPADARLPGPGMLGTQDADGAPRSGG